MSQALGADGIFWPSELGLHCSLLDELWTALLRWLEVFSRKAKSGVIQHRGNKF